MSPNASNFNIKPARMVDMSDTGTDHALAHCVPTADVKLCESVLYFCWS